jgi:hypothetical protein
MRRATGDFISKNCQSTGVGHQVETVPDLKQFSALSKSRPSPASSGPRGAAKKISVGQSRGIGIHLDAGPCEITAESLRTSAEIAEKI